MQVALSKQIKLSRKLGHTYFTLPDLEASDEIETLLPTLTGENEKLLYQIWTMPLLAGLRRAAESRR